MGLNTTIQFSLLLLYHDIRALGFVILAVRFVLFQYTACTAARSLSGSPSGLLRNQINWEAGSPNTSRLGYSPAPSSIHSMHCCSLSLPSARLTTENELNILTGCLPLCCATIGRACLRSLQSPSCPPPRSSNRPRRLTRLNSLFPQAQLSKFLDLGLLGLGFHGVSSIWGYAD